LSFRVNFIYIFLHLFQFATFSIRTIDTAIDCIGKAFSEMKLAEMEPSKTQLWASITGLEGNEYPLIGHESPFTIRKHYANATVYSTHEEINVFGASS
jgi:hypothetical protein